MRACSRLRARRTLRQRCAKILSRIRMIGPLVSTHAGKNSLQNLGAAAGETFEPLMEQLVFLVEGPDGSAESEDGEYK